MTQWEEERERTVTHEENALDIYSIMTKILTYVDEVRIIDIKQLDIVTK